MPSLDMRRLNDIKLTSDSARAARSSFGRSATISMTGSTYFFPSSFSHSASKSSVIARPSLINSANAFLPMRTVRSSSPPPKHKRPMEAPLVCNFGPGSSVGLPNNLRSRLTR
jgi:hypothetical protein